MTRLTLKCSLCPVLDSTSAVTGLRAALISPKAWSREHLRSLAAIPLLYYLQRCSLAQTESCCELFVCVWQKWRVLLACEWAGGWMSWHEISCFSLFVQVSHIFRFSTIIKWTKQLKHILLTDPHFNQHMVLACWKPVLTVLSHLLLQKADYQSGNKSGFVLIESILEFYFILSQPIFEYIGEKHVYFYV